MTVSEMQMRDMLGAIDDCPVTFSYAGSDITGMRGGLISSERLVEGGWLSEPALSITTTMKLLDTDGTTWIDRFVTTPTHGEKFTIDSIDYRIDRVIQDEFSACIQFDLITPNR